MRGQIKSTNLKQEMKSYLAGEIHDSNSSCLTTSDLITIIIIKKKYAV
jgi:hypothetical protein